MQRLSLSDQTWRHSFNNDINVKYYVTVNMIFLFCLLNADIRIETDYSLVSILSLFLPRRNKIINLLPTFFCKSFPFALLVVSALRCRSFLSFNSFIAFQKDVPLNFNSICL